jgi:hypothetical protein
MVTSQGDLQLTLDRARAPGAAASFSYLAEQGFFDGTACHREVNEPIFGVLQCGDPSGTGPGGPSYRFDQEVTPATAYPRGTVAMADYTVVGTVDAAGLAVLDDIAAAGNDGSLDSSAGGGAPNVPVEIRSITVAG